jgi:hypothetical protein
MNGNVNGTGRKRIWFWEMGCTHARTLVHGWNEQWEETYSRYLRDLLSSISTMGSTGYTTAFCIGEHKGSRLISSAEDEQKIPRLVVVVDHMLNRCEETIRHTSRLILCWLCTGHGSSCLPRPITFLGRPSSRQQYRLYFKRFVAFIFRAYRMDPTLRKTLLGVTFKKIQLDMLKAIWSHRTLNSKLEQIPTNIPKGDREGLRLSVITLGL